jgi:hypothetical protein
MKARTAFAGRRALAVVLRALLASALLTASAVVATATPAAAEGEPVANLWWVRCQDQSEPGSDEPYVVLLSGQQIASGNNIDPGDKFYFFNNSQQPIIGDYLVLELREDDGIWGDDHLGYFYVYASDQGQGEKESYVFGNGEYILHYVVT